MQSKLTPNRAVLLGMLFFLICGTIWALRVPIENAVPISFNSDEPSHFQVVRYVSEHWALPPYTPDYYELHNPPLSDWIEAGYIKLFPLPVQALALRFFSLVFGLAILFTIFKTAKQLVNDWTAVFATLVASTLPMFVTFSSSVSNDPLAVWLSCFSLYWIVKGVKAGFSKPQLNVLCVLVGLAGIAKYTLLGLVPVSMGIAIFDRRKQGKNWIVPVLSMAATFVLISGWWFLRNQILFGDPFRSKAELEMHMFNGSAAPLSSAYWMKVTTTMVGSFVGVYPHSPNWPLSVYDAFTALFGLILLVAFFVQLRRSWPPVKVVLVAYLGFVLVTVLAYQLNHFQPHGRLLYPAITVIVLGIAGIRHLVPEAKRSRLAIAFVAALAVLTLVMVTTTSFS